MKKILALNALLFATVTTASAGPLQKADTDADGYVSASEYQAFHSARGEARFARLDSNSDGLLSEQELSKAAKRGGRQGKRRGRSNRGERFAEQDTDGSGGLSRAELAESPRFDEERFLATDTDGNGELSKQELKAAKKARRNAQQ